MRKIAGFIGLGKMGLPMAKNLLNNDYPVIGIDVNAASLSEFEKSGGKTGNLEEIIQTADYLILMLPASKIVNQVIDQIIEIYETVKRNHTESLIIIDMSSSYPSDTRKNAWKLQEKNIQFIDAPVSGGVKKATTSTLTIMMGGTVDQFEYCKRFLSTMGSNIFHIGPIGSGHLMKAINNYLSAGHLLMSCEAIQLLESNDVAPETAIHVINQSTGKSGSTEYKFPSFILSNTYDSGFSLELMRKDIAMAKQLFTEADANTLLPQMVSQTFSEACTELPKEADHTEIYKHVSAYLLKRGNTDEKSKEIFSNHNDSRIGI